jgi:hypothetical protein
MNHVTRFGILTSALATAALMACGGSSSNTHATGAYDMGTPNTQPNPNSLPASPGEHPRSTYIETYPETPESTPPPVNATTPGSMQGQPSAPVVTPPNANSGGGGMQSPGYPPSR